MTHIRSHARAYAHPRTHADTHTHTHARTQAHATRSYRDGGRACVATAGAVARHKRRSHPPGSTHHTRGCPGRTSERAAQLRKWGRAICSGDVTGLVCVRKVCVLFIGSAFNVFNCEKWQTWSVFAQKHIVSPSPHLHQSSLDAGRLDWVDSARALLSNLSGNDVTCEPDSPSEPKTVADIQLADTLSKIEGVRAQLDSLQPQLDLIERKKAEQTMQEQTQREAAELRDTIRVERAAFQAEKRRLEEELNRLRGGGEAMKSVAAGGSKGQSSGAPVDDDDDDEYEDVTLPLPAPASRSPLPATPRLAADAAANVRDLKLSLAPEVVEAERELHGQAPATSRFFGSPRYVELDVRGERLPGSDKGAHYVVLGIDLRTKDVLHHTSWADDAESRFMVEVRTLITLISSNNRNITLSALIALI